MDGFNRKLMRNLDRSFDFAQIPVRRRWLRFKACRIRPASWPMQFFRRTAERENRPSRAECGRFLAEYISGSGAQGQSPLAIAVATSLGPARSKASHAQTGGTGLAVMNHAYATAVTALALLVAALLVGCADDGGGLSRLEVEEIVRSELVEARDQQAAMAPPRYVPEEFTRFLVREAIGRYESEGLDATLAHYNSGESMDGQWYVFIGDPDGAMLAHAADPGLVDRPISAAVGPNAYPAGEALAAVADEDGEWFSYTYPNPSTGAVETKHSWVVRHDGLVFGSGWYEAGPRKADAPVYTRTLVRQALDLYDALGLRDSVAYYSSLVSVDGPWYVFIIGEDGRIIAHYDPERVGLDANTLTDSAGRLYGPELVETTEEGGWVDYVKLNPETGQEQQKHTWVVRHDGLVFGSGWYELQRRAG